MREDRSILDFIEGDFTYINERLARLYWIQGVEGKEPRRVSLAGTPRLGVLMHASVLALNAHESNTSPSRRGKFVRETILCQSIPDPPPNVQTNLPPSAANLETTRKRVEAHIKDPSCASCHQLMDPIGLALENFDAIGRYRDVEFGEPIDASGGLPDGSTFTGVNGLEDALLKRPDLLANTISERLLTYALGRGVEPSDAPAVRKIVHDAKAEDYRLSAIIIGITQSVPFQMRMTE